MEGFLGNREGVYLYRLAKLGAKLGAVVEIGSWKGKSTIWLAKGSQAVGGQAVYAIDPHVGSPEHVQWSQTKINTEQEFRLNMQGAGVESQVIPLIESSMAALRQWHQPVGFLWIDGEHSYEAVAQDFYGWRPHVVDGGIIAFHDTYSWEGVRRLIDEEVLQSPGLRVLGQWDGILALQKCQSLTARDRMRLAAVRRLRLIFNRARLERKHWRALPRKLLRAMATPR